VELPPEQRLLHTQRLARSRHWHAAAMLLATIVSVRPSAAPSSTIINHHHHWQAVTARQT
jgi:hypothetical protein